MKNLTNLKFGRLTVIRRHTNNIKNRPAWLCLCDCGNVKVLRASYLKNTKSCGCLRKENSIPKRKKYGEASFKILYCKYKDSAKSRNLKFELIIEEFKKLTSSNCVYCGVKPSSIIKRKNNFGEYIYNGIDRVNNKIGYILNNCVPCCKICNYAKNDNSQDEFINWLNQLIEYRSNKNEFNS